jgi:DNA-binding MarR family transcriptional regulator
MEIAMAEISLDEPAFPGHHTVPEILAHPRFPVARTAMVEAMLALYEHDPFLNRLLLEVGRNVVFVVIMCLDAGYDEADRATWPTLSAVTQAMAAFGIASPRRIADLVSRLVETGYIEQAVAARDARVRILRPTAKMIALDQDWLVAHYAPLHVLFPDPGYAPIMERDRDFQRRQRLAAVGQFPLAALVMGRNQTMMQFMNREAGIMVVIKLLHLAGPNGDTAREIAYTDIGTRFGVSRTQVRKLLEDAEAKGLVRLNRGRTLTAQPTRALLDAFDRLVADTMAAHDFTFKLAADATAQSREAAKTSQDISAPGEP